MPEPRSKRVDHAVVIVPAHNEAASIAMTLTSIVRAAGHEALSVGVRVIVVLDACVDETADVVQSHVSNENSVHWNHVEVSVQRASSARQAGLDELERGGVGSEPGRTAVLSTDADTVVPPDWILRHVRLLDAGHDGVAGIVDLSPAARNDLRLDAWRSEYESRFGADGSHPHVHAANLSVRLDVLTAAGGFGHLTRAEDIDLWRRLRSSTTARLRSDRSIVVRTSHREDGRVEGGFATALDQFRPTLRPTSSDLSVTPHIQTKRLVSE